MGLVDRERCDTHRIDLLPDSILHVLLMKQQPVSRN